MREPDGQSGLAKFNRYSVVDNRPGLVDCPYCVRRVKAAGLRDHLRDFHPDKEQKCLI